MSTYFLPTALGIGEHINLTVPGIDEHILLTVLGIDEHILLTVPGINEHIHTSKCSYCSRNMR